MKKIKIVCLFDYNTSDSSLSNINICAILQTNEPDVKTTGIFNACVCPMQQPVLH